MALDRDSVRFLKSAYLELGQVFDVDTDRVAAKHFARAELLITKARDNEPVGAEKDAVAQILTDHFGITNFTASYMGYSTAKAMEDIEKDLGIDVDYVPSPLRGGDLQPSA